MVVNRASARRGTVGGGVVECSCVVVQSEAEKTMMGGWVDGGTETI